MNWKLSLLLFVFFNTDVMAHGGHMATYKYQIESSLILLEFKIESGVLDHFSLDETCENYQSTTALCLVQYLQENTRLSVNGSEVAFELQSSRQDEDHFIIQMVARGDFSASGRLLISNSCFLEYDPEFENRIIVQKEDFAKSYRLDDQHQALKIDLKT